MACPDRPFPRVRLLCCAALATGIARPAHAQAQADHGESVTVNGATRANAIGSGLMVRQDAAKSVSAVTAAYIEKQPPSQNPYQLLKLLPGANVANADPYGLTTGNITVRGLNSDQIGFILDGASLNDIGTYSAFPTEWVDSENLERITLEQGSANLDTPVIGASGGIVDMTLRHPSAKAGGLVNLSYGSYHTDREFIRLDSGEIGRSGVSAFVSYSKIYEPHFRGPGADHKQHVDFKAVRDWRGGSTSEVALTFDDSVKTSYRSPSLAQWQTMGRDFNYASPFVANDTAFFKLHQTPYRVVILTAPQHLVLSRDASLDLTPYLYFNGGSLAGATVLSEGGFFYGTQRVTADLNGNGTTRDRVLLYTPSVTPYVYRPGLVSKLNYALGRHHLVFGDWYEWSATRLLNPYSPVGADGGAADEWGQGEDVKLAGGVRVASYDNYTETQVNSLFLGDSFAATRRLTLDAGFKETMVNRVGYNYLPGARYRTELNDAESLPTIGARYRFDERNQVFADAATNFRTPSLNALYDTYSATTGAVTTAANPAQKAEYAISEELGYRYGGDVVNGTVTLFNYNFTNRQVATTAIVNGAQVTQNINSGGQTSRGVDVEIGTRPFHHFRPYVSAEYLHATIDNDYKVGADALPTAGKRAIRAPEVQAAFSLDYDRGDFFADVSVKYTGRQFSTFTNDQAMPGFVSSDMAFGYRVHPVRGVRPEVRLNLVNVGDNKYLSSVSGIAASSRATLGRRGTVIAAQGTPTYLVGGGFAALLTASAAF